jgi:hypothetical protein
VSNGMEDGFGKAGGVGSAADLNRARAAKISRTDDGSEVESHTIGQVSEESSDRA